MIIARTTMSDNIGQGEVRDPEDCCLKRRGSYLRWFSLVERIRRALFTPATFASARRTVRVVSCEPPK
jgi:hypothetical protein